MLRNSELYSFKNQMKNRLGQAKTATKQLNSPLWSPRTVSYTHLDVYKRQLTTLLEKYKTKCVLTI